MILGKTQWKKEDSLFNEGFGTTRWPRAGKTNKPHTHKRNLTYTKMNSKRITDLNVKHKNDKIPVRTHLRGPGFGKGFVDTA